ALIRLEPDGRFERVLTSFGDVPFVYPNDLCFGPDGLLYLTESGITDEGLAPGGEFRADWKTAAVDGRVYRVDPRSLEIGQVARRIETPGKQTTNACFGFGDSEQLYVTEYGRGHLERFDVGVRGRPLWR